MDIANMTGADWLESLRVASTFIGGACLVISAVVSSGWSVAKILGAASRLVFFRPTEPAADILRRLTTPGALKLTGEDTVGDDSVRVVPAKKEPKVYLATGSKGTFERSEQLVSRRELRHIIRHGKRLLTKLQQEKRDAEKELAAAWLQASKPKAKA